MLIRFVWHWLVLALGLYLITLLPLGITVDSNRDLLWAALVLILVNAIIKPILIIISLPLVLLTLGLFLFVINAIILYTLPSLVHGFHVPSFLAAFFGSLILSLITGAFTGWERQARIQRTRTDSGRVIDI